MIPLTLPVMYHAIRAVHNGQGFVMPAQLCADEDRSRPNCLFRPSGNCSSLTLKRTVNVGVECADLPTLQEALTNEFGAQLKETRVDQMLLLSESPDLDERGKHAWERITAQSDIVQVVAHGALKLTEASATAEDDYEVAFQLEESEILPVAQPRSRERKRAAKKAADVQTGGAGGGGGGGRFSDDILDTDDSAGKPLVELDRFADEDSS